MYDLFEALERASRLDESSAEWFTKMKDWLKETSASEEEFFWSEYHDHVDEIYGKAIEKVREDYKNLNVEFEFSTQAGKGMCEVFGNDKEGSGYYRWDFRNDRQDVFDFVNESESVEELLDALVDYLSGKVESMTWKDNNSADDGFEESLKEAMKKDKPVRSSGYAYTIRDIRAHADKVVKETNKHEQARMIKDLVSGCRITIKEVNDLVDRLTKYSSAMDAFVTSKRTDADAKILLDSIKDLSI